MLAGLCLLAAGMDSVGSLIGSTIIVVLVVGLAAAGLWFIISGRTEEQVLREPSSDDGETPKCPYCAQSVTRDALVCHYCGNPLPSMKEADRYFFINF